MLAYSQSQNPDPLKTRGSATRKFKTASKRAPPAAKSGSPRDNLIWRLAKMALRRFWQRRFYDFNVWSLKKRVEKLHYMHMNPLKRKLVDHPRDWPWSSFSFYSDLKSGLIRVDPVN
jgi:hypothetical protein